MSCKIIIWQILQFEWQTWLEVTTMYTCNEENKSISLIYHYLNE